MHFKNLERPVRIGLTSKPWQGFVLPLYDGRIWWAYPESNWDGFTAGRFSYHYSFHYQFSVCGLDYIFIYLRCNPHSLYTFII